MFLVIKAFYDLEDGNYLYSVGDKYPRTGARPSADRVLSLATENNKQGVSLIKEVKGKRSPKKEK